MKENYTDLIKEHIELDKLLSITKPKYHDKIRNLLNQKKEIIKKNGFLAELKLNRINKKIEKISKKE